MAIDYLLSKTPRFILIHGFWFGSLGHPSFSIICLGHKKRSHHNEKPVHRLTRESPHTGVKTQCSHKENKRMEILFLPWTLGVRKRGRKKSFIFKIRAVSQALSDLGVADLTCLVKTCMLCSQQVQDSGYSHWMWPWLIAYS